ncbi:hypothetical protein GQX74_009732 [Glossina fuscipes]|nr:hypothetical protein GQX74_009732 [Glossina fuscipes]
MIIHLRTFSDKRKAQILQRPYSFSSLHEISRFKAVQKRSHEQFATYIGQEMHMKSYILEGFFKFEQFPPVSIELLIEKFLKNCKVEIGRYLQCKRELKSSLAPYREILKELQDRNRQVFATTSGDFCNDGEITSEEEFRLTLRKRKSIAFLVTRFRYNTPVQPVKMNESKYHTPHYEATVEN